DVRLRGAWSRPEWQGTAAVKDLVFRVRKLERDLRIDGGTIAFDNFDVAIGCPRSGRKPDRCRSLSGLLGEGSRISRVDGRISFGEELSLKNLDVWVDGSEIDYHQPGWSVKFSPQVELYGNGNQLTLRGNINLVEGRYSQNFELVSMIFRPKT